jgi:hypothetical protein
MVILEKLPLVALSVGFAFFQIVASQRVLVAGESLPLVSRRLPNALYAFDWYLVKTIWPTDLHPAHTHFGVVHPAWLVAARRARSSPAAWAQWPASGRSAPKPAAPAGTRPAAPATPHLRAHG